MIEEKAIEAMRKGFICDNCLGRQFAMLLSGLTNKERGKVIRLYLAMKYEIKYFNVDNSNFYQIKFLKRKVKTQKPIKCYVCDDLFNKLDRYLKESVEKLKDYEFSSFMVGVKLNDTIAIKEESLWENIGSKFSEPINFEINRELGKLIERKVRKEVDEINPDIRIILNLAKDRIEFQVRPMYIYGVYYKLCAGIPQTRLYGYRKSIESIIGDPFINETSGRNYTLHVNGREDINTKCLAGRPFILEIKHPKKREINLNKIKRMVNKSKGVKINDLRFSNKNELVKLKRNTYVVTYNVLVTFKKLVDDMEKVKRIVGEIKQRTPQRFLQFRKDKTKNKTVKAIKWKRINNKRYQLIITAESGLYIKELITGDNKRTTPSISEVLGEEPIIRKIDIIKIKENKHGSKKQRI